MGASPQGNVIKTNLWVGLHPPVPPLARCLLSASSRSRDAGDPLAWVVVPPEKRRVPAAPRTLAAPSALWRTGLVMRPMNGTGVANVLAVADLCAPAQTRASGMRALRRCKLWRRLDVAARVPCRGAVLPWGRVPRECGLIRLQGRQRRRQTLALSPELLANVDMSLPVLSLCLFGNITSVSVGLAADREVQAHVFRRCLGHRGPRSLGGSRSEFVRRRCPCSPPRS